MAEVIVTLLGLTGPAKDLVDAVNEVKERTEALKENPARIQKLLNECSQLQHDVQEVHIDDEETAISPAYVQQLKRDVAKIATFISTTKRTLEEKHKCDEGKFRRFLHARGEQGELLDLLSSSQDARKELSQIRASLEAQKRFDRVDKQLNSSRTIQDTFSAAFMVPRNPTSVTMDFNLGNDGNPTTCEGLLLQALLETNQEAAMGAFAVGQGGVGKTCALIAIANEKEVQNRFTGGVYFMSLGADAKIGKLIKGLADAVESSGGREVSTEMRQENNLTTVIAKAKSWFHGRDCLFIVDDIWQGHDIDEDILSRLSILTQSTGAGLGSRIMYSTRDRRLGSYGIGIEFGARESTGDEARRMLLGAAGAHPSEMNDLQCKDSIIELLTVCAGLPIALNAVGSSVQLIRRQFRGDLKRAWKQYLDDLKDEGRQLVLHQEPDGYKCLSAMLGLALKILDEGGKQRMDMSYSEMHRSLCVMEKQDWIPVNALLRMWNIPDRKLVETAVMEMERVGVAQCDRREVGDKLLLGLQVHDLTLKYAETEAEKYEGVAWWCEKLLDGYVQHERREQYLGWVAEIEDDGFFFRSVCRLALLVGRSKWVRRLLLCPKWVLKMMEMRAVPQLEEDVRLYFEHERHTDTVPDFGETENKMEVEVGLGMISKAARLSMQYSDGRGKHACFQLYGRLLRAGQRYKIISKFMSELAEAAPKPWLKPMTECLTSADTSVVDVFPVPYEVESVQFLTGGGYISCGLIDSFENRNRNMEVRTHLPNGKTHTVSLQYEKEARGDCTDVHGESGDREDVLGSSKDECSSHNDTVGASASNVGEIEHRKFWQNLCGCFLAKGVSTASSEDIGANSRVEEEEENGKCGSGARNLNGEPRCSVFSRTGTRVAFGFQNGKVGIADAQSGKLLWMSVTAHDDLVKCVAISGDGKWVVSGSLDNTVRVWNVLTGETVRDALKGHTDWINCVAISGDGKWVVSGSNDRTAHVWNVLSGKAVGNALAGHTTLPYSVGISDDGKWVVSGLHDGTVRVWNALSAQCVGDALRGHTRSVNCVAISGDGRWVVSGSLDHTVRVWNMLSGEAVGGALMGHTGWVRSVAISRDGKWVVSGCNDNTVRVWEAMNRQREGDESRSHTDSVCCVAISRDGKWVASGSFDKTVRLWNAVSGEAVGDALRGHTELVSCIAISGDGACVVSGSHDHTVRVWNALSGEAVGDALRGHEGWLYRVAISGNGKWVVSGSEDQTIRVWNALSGEAVGDALRGHTSSVHRVAISEDGKWAVSGSLIDRTVRVWATDAMKCVRVIEDGIFGFRGICGEYLGDGQDEVDASLEDGKIRMEWDKGRRIWFCSEDCSEVVACFESYMHSFIVNCQHGNVVCVVGKYVGFLKMVV